MLSIVVAVVFAVSDIDIVIWRITDNLHGGRETADTLSYVSDQWTRINQHITFSYSVLIWSLSWNLGLVLLISDLYHNSLDRKSTGNYFWWMTLFVQVIHSSSSTLLIHYLHIIYISLFHSLILYQHHCRNDHPLILDRSSRGPRDFTSGAICVFGSRLNIFTDSIKSKNSDWGKNEKFYANATYSGPFFCNLQRLTPSKLTSKHRFICCRWLYILYMNT